MKCKHKWIDMEDGTFDQLCVKCSLKQMRSVMKPIAAEITAPVAMPMGRETMEVPLCDSHVRVEVYKADLLKQINKKIRLSIDHFSNPMGR